MKRLVGVVILAGVAAACGTTTTTTPDVASLTDANGTVSSLATTPRAVPGPRTTCVKGDRSQVRAIGVTILGQGDGFTTVRAVITESAGADDPVPVCLTPTWRVAPKATLVPVDSETVTVYGSVGKYEVTATSFVETTSSRLRATAVIDVH